MACILNIAEHLAHQLHPADIQPSSGMGQSRGANFYYDTHGCTSSG